VYKEDRAQIFKTQVASFLFSDSDVTSKLKNRD